MAEQKTTFREYLQFKINSQFVSRYVDITKCQTVFTRNHCHHCPRFTTSRFPIFLCDHLIWKHLNELSEEEKKDECTTH